MKRMTHQQMVDALAKLTVTARDHGFTLLTFDAMIDAILDDKPDRFFTLLKNAYVAIATQKIPELYKRADDIRRAFLAEIREQKGQNNE
jgi:hypothetical protein